MRFSVTTAPTTELITISQARSWLRLGHGDEEDDLLLLATAVREELEQDLSRSLIRQTVTLWLDIKEASDPIWLPLPPALSVTSVTAFTDASSTAVSSALYRLTSALDPARLLPAPSTNGWYDAMERTEDALRIIYAAGYGARASVPAPIRLEARRRFWHYWRSGRDASIEAPTTTPGYERYRYNYLTVMV